MILTVTLNASIDKRYVVDEFRPGEVNRVRECLYTPGGKGLNVSRSLMIAGAEVLATGMVGGYAGQYIVEALGACGVRNDFCRVQGESRSCINILDKKTGSQTEFLEPGFTVSEDSFDAFKRKYETLLESAAVVAISGSVPRGLDGTAYQELISSAKAKGKKVVLDTSGSLLEAGISAKPTMIKPNIDEIRMLTGRPCGSRQELVQAAAELHGKGIDYVVISLGGDGSVLVCKSGAYRAVVPKLEAVNTTGCGDAMVAGLSLALAGGMEPAEMLREASAISAAAALAAETGSFSPADRTRLMPLIQIEKILQEDEINVK